MKGMFIGCTQHLTRSFIVSQRLCSSTSRILEAGISAVGTEPLKKKDNHSKYLRNQESLYTVQRFLQKLKLSFLEDVDCFDEQKTIHLLEESDLVVMPADNKTEYVDKSEEEDRRNSALTWIRANLQEFYLEEIINIYKNNSQATKEDLRKAESDLFWCNMVLRDYNKYRELDDKLWFLAIRQDNWLDLDINNPKEAIKKTVFYKLSILDIDRGTINAGIDMVKVILSEELDDFNSDSTFYHNIKLCYEELEKYKHISGYYNRPLIKMFKKRELLKV